MKIIHQETPVEGFFAIEGNNVIGEMTYKWSGDKTFIINHTAVIEKYKGQGIGLKLLNKAVVFARENNCTIYPLCSFVRAIFDKNPKYNDVRK